METTETTAAEGLDELQATCDAHFYYLLKLTKGTDLEAAVRMSIKASEALTDFWSTETDYAMKQLFALQGIKVQEQGESTE
jgi:hypothetical protein